MNIMMVAAAAGQGSSSALPLHEGTLFALFFGIVGAMLLTAAACTVFRSSQRAIQQGDWLA